MSYKVKINEQSVWVDNSMKPIEEFVQRNIGDRMELVKDFYERDYGVKVYDFWGMWTEIEFPTKKDATMFMLKWA